jgi:hypothetical protein
MYNITGEITKRVKAEFYIRDIEDFNLALNLAEIMCGACNNVYVTDSETGEILRSAYSATDIFDPMYSIDYMMNIINTIVERV